MNDDFFTRRLIDLADQADRTCRYTFTDFLTEAETAQFQAIRSQLPHCGTALWGGHPDADRVMLRFGDPEQLGYEEPFPLTALYIAPVQEKFAESLTHRDILGAVMHLGIVRSAVGDILIDGKCAYLFIKEDLAEYLCRELTRIRHTTVTCTVAEQLPAAAEQKTEEITVQAASERIDAVAAKVYHLSRSECLELLRLEHIAVGGAPVTKSSYTLRAGDKVSVRGHGKFRYLGQSGTTRKGNLLLRCEKFV